MAEPQTWRELLGIIIADPRERQRISNELGIRAITLIRWVNGETDPRPQNLHNLLNVIPEHRDQMRDLIRKEAGFENFSDELVDDTSKDIPSEFYARVLTARSSNSENMRFWSTCNLLVQEVLEQLDPDRQGMAIYVVRCMPRWADNKIHSLRESVGQGTPPWSGNLELKAMFLGAESLAGYIVTTCLPHSIANTREERSLIPSHSAEYEKSASAYPIMFAGRVAGCHLCCSTQENYFLPQARQELIKNYAELMALAFESKEFYDPQDIALYVMPNQYEQKKHFTNFRQRVADMIIDAARVRHSIDSIQAEQVVWRQLEEELLGVASGSKK